MASRTIKALVSLLVAGMPGLLEGACAQFVPLAPFVSPQVVADAQLLRLEANLQQAMGTGDFVGLAVAVVRGGEVTLLRTYG